jgi:hypothetical protein
MPLHSIISDSGLAGVHDPDMWCSICGICHCVKCFNDRHASDLAMLVLNPRRRVTTDQDPVGELPEPAERNSQPTDT